MKRLRAQLGPDGYQVVRSNDRWPDHQARTLVTASAIAWCKPETLIDPACGDASIAIAANSLSPIGSAFLSDISAPQIESLRRHVRDEDHAFQGRGLLSKSTLVVADALTSLAWGDTFDVVVLTEILEHVEDPAEILLRARPRGKFLVASSPLDESPGTGNHEHVWSFSKEDYRGLLEAAGWNPIAYHELSFFPPYYTFQLWVAR